jgi:excisionase family DNA binding protein
VAQPLTPDDLRDLIADALEGAAERLRRARPPASPVKVEPPFGSPPVEDLPASTRLALSVSEAAESLGIGRSSLYEAIRARRLPVLRIGRRTLIPVAALKAWVTDAIVTSTNDDL